MFSCSSSSPFSDNMDNYNSDRISSNIWGGNGNGNGISNSNQDDNKFGFEIPKFKSFAPSSLPFSSSNPLSPSPFLASTPPAFSPSIFLDSPAFFSSSNILPSPTTGSFAAQNNQSQQDTKREQNNFIDFSFHPNPRPLPTTSMAITLHSSSNNFSMEQQNWTLSKPMKQPDFAPVKIQPSHVPIPSNQHNGEIRKLDDGYNWRKYGQKQVKGSENPRSYYKCTFPNCATKKKVERSLDGQITEIVYKGSHNHPKPQSTRRSSSSHSMVNPEISDHSVNDTTDCLMLQEDNTSGSTGGDVFEQGSPLSNLDDDNETEPDAKRWKGESENEGYVVGSGSRTVREPRIVVQTTSDIDILDDGYRWRKYGQKVVKGNPNPRSYYKCTTIGCPVRKHVERASQDMRAVITAYEGKHNHDVPAARGSGYAMNRLSSNPSTTTTATMPIRPSAVSSNSANFPYSLGPSGPAALGRLEMQRGDGGFGIMNQAQPMYGAFPRAKEESKDDSFFDSFLS